MGQKKCVECGCWNEGAVDTCSSCGQLLDTNKKEQVRLKKLGKLPLKIKESQLFEIKPEYPLWRKTILYILRPIYWTFMVIASFFIWLTVWISA